MTLWNIFGLSISLDFIVKEKIWIVYYRFKTFFYFKIVVNLCQLNTHPKLVNCIPQALLPEDFGRPSSAVSGSVSSHTSDSSGGDSLPFDPVCSGLMQILSTVLSCLAKNNPSSNCSEASSERMSGTGDAFANRGNDLIRYHSFPFFLFSIVGQPFFCVCN